ncbi:MAG: hypothetical protein U0175_37885 [Caldilineaceae bacterium]
MSSLLAQPANFLFGRFNDESTANYPWLYNRRWDLVFLIFSACLCVVPYSTYLLFGGNETSRMLVNGLVTLLVAGPHTYATFNRTLLNPDFRQRKRLFVGSSILIPFTVGFLIITNYVAMLTAFFLMASVHALHQVTYLNDCYTKKSGIRQSWWGWMIDFGVVFSSLYPWTVYKMMLGKFYVGPVQLWSPFNPGQFLHGQWWMVYAVFAAFAAFVIAFAVKSFLEWRKGILNVPKTLLVAVTLPVMHFSPLVDNLDTAFQGINAWHSFQYLAITWFVIRRSEARNERQQYSLFNQFRASFATLVQWIQAKVKGQSLTITPEQSTLMWTAAFYTFQLLMLPISALGFIFAHVFFPNLPYPEQYSYMMVLPILLVHYYHDAFLFTQPESLTE